MNNTEQFDEWIRGEMDNLDDSPDHFRQGDIWQKLQTELHPVSEKKSFFVTLKASHYRIAAAVALFLLVGGIWWKIEQISSQMTVSQGVNQPKNSPVLQEKQMVLAAKKDVLKEEATLEKQVSLKKQSKEELSGINFVKVPNFDKVEIQVPSVVNSELENNVGKDWPAPADRSGVPNLADVSEAPKNRAEISELSEIVTVPEKPNQSTTKITPKPKFKIVHANELADYQKAELAEVREKEAKAKGFVVINWNANSTNQSATGLLTHFKNKSSKAD